MESARSHYRAYISIIINKYVRMAFEDHVNALLNILHLRV